MNPIYGNGSVRVQTDGRQTLGVIGVDDPTARANLTKLTTGIALAGGAVYALLSIPGTRPVKKAALGALGGGLLVTAILNVYDVVA